MIKLLLIVILLYVYDANSQECVQVPYEEWNSKLPYSANTKDFKEMVENIKARRKFMCLNQTAPEKGVTQLDSKGQTIIYQRDKWGTIRYDQPSYIIIQK